MSKNNNEVFGVLSNLGARSSVYDVRTVAQMHGANPEKGIGPSWEKLGTESLGFVYGLAYFDQDKKTIASIEEYLNNLEEKDKTVYRFNMAMTLTSSFSDAYLVWHSPLASEMMGRIEDEPPRELQDKVVEWLLGGIKENSGNEMFLRGTLTAMARIESGDSILDEVDYIRLEDEIGPEGMKLKKEQERDLLGQLSDSLRVIEEDKGKNEQ